MLRRAAFLLGTLVVLALIGGCGGRPDRAGEAGGTNGKAAKAAAANCAGTCRLAHLIDYSRCMRAEGVPSFADPVPVTSPSGKPGWMISYGGNPDSAAFVKAQSACKHYAPDAASSPTALTPTQQQAWLEWAACIRVHGFPSFPDPTFSGGGVAVPSLTGGGATKAGAAKRACSHNLAGT